MPRKLRFLRIFGLLALLTLAAPAGAQSVPESAPRDEVTVSERTAATSERAADQGLLVPFTQSPQVYSGHALFKATAGYDTALDDFVARTSADARVFPFLALRLDFDHGPGMGPDDRFGVGARLQVLRQAASGVDGAIGLAYQPNDFREEGHIVGSVLVGRRFGRLQLLGNALFGGDPEGDDQAGEARVAAVYRVVRQVHLGIDSRFRSNFSEDEKRAGTLATDWELQSTPTLSFGAGPFALLCQAGLSIVQTTGPFGTEQERTRVRSGVVAMAGAGGGF